jgi:diguanylate cyclase (GGDEF)-like protein
MERPLRRPGWCGGLALLLGALFTGLLWLAPGGRFAELAVDDLGQLLAAGLAALGCAAAARGGDGRQRRAWWLLAAGAASWAAGQAVWSWYELVAGREVPFPSAADLGFLGFPVLAGLGLLTWLADGRGVASPARDLLDGVIAAGSLLIVSWVSMLGAVHAAGADDRLAFALSLAYPIGDVVLASLVLLTLSRSAPGRRGPLLLMAAGLGWLAVADSAYVFLTAAGTYASGDLLSAGWVTGFLLLAAAGASSPAGNPPAGPARTRPSRQRLALPYLPLLAAFAAVGGQAATGRPVPAVEVVAGLVVIALVLARQGLALTDNHRLLAELHAAQDQLRHQALHDPLTGIANRALFADRVEHALALQQRCPTGVAVIFCDLDGFKPVNDGLGHAAGDALLREVADRLLQCLRPSDTVARLGGDEFAVLLERPADARPVAERIVAVLAEPYLLDDAAVRITVSVGMAAADPQDARAGATAGWLLRQADGAMYAAKANGGGRAVHAAALTPRAGHPLAGAR